MEKSKLIRSGKHSECPVCGRTKDSDCSWVIDRSLVLCHNNFDHENSTRFGYLSAKQNYKYIGPTADSRCGKYVREDFQKAPRKSQTRNWVYTDKNNNPLINVRRIDQEGGDKKIVQGRYDPSAFNADENGFVYEKGGISDYSEIKKQVTILYYQEVQEAIRFGIPVYWVEGEKAVEAMRSIGFIATTSIGGSKALQEYGDYRGQLLGANLVICPDADEIGIEYAEQVEAFFSKETASIKWLYCQPYSPVWTNLPKANGIDVADWIEQGADKNLIESSVGEKRNLSQEIELQSVREKYNKISSQIRAIDLTISHPGERYFALLEMGKKFNLKPSEIQHLRDLQPTGKKINPERFSDFCERIDDNVEWLVEDMIPRSHNILLAGQSGSGKSLLAYDLVYCVLNGTPWLGRFNTKKGRVLFFQLEEGEGYVPKSRALFRGIPKDEVNLMMMFSGSAGDIPDIISFCASEEIDLCIIDSLNAINGSNAVNENSPIYALPLQQLTSAAAQIKTTFITIHHTKKPQDGARTEEDNVDEVRGSSAITANAQAVMIFKKYRKEGELARSIKYAKARIKVDYSKHIIKLNTANNSYNYVGNLSEGKVDEEATRKPGAKAQEIAEEGLAKTREYLLNSPYRHERIELSNALQIPTQNLEAYLYHLEQEGVVVKEKDKITGRYTWRAASGSFLENENFIIVDQIDNLAKEEDSFYAS